MILLTDLRRAGRRHSHFQRRPPAECVKGKGFASSLGPGTLGYSPAAAPTLDSPGTQSALPKMRLPPKAWLSSFRHNTRAPPILLLQVVLFSISILPPTKLKWFPFRLYSGALFDCFLQLPRIGFPTK